MAIVAASTLLAAPAVFSQETTAAGLVVHSGPSAAVQAWKSALEAGDTKAIAQMHSPSTVLYSADSSVTRGVDEIMRGYRALYEKYRPTVEIRDAGWVRQGELLNSWGQFVMTLTPLAGGEPIRVDGRFSDVAIWTNGHWQYVMDHASVPTR
ncbi:hypothetical protein A9762_01640 [Pandoraea sp. ISTKB]|nr:hypothetical protein A9762_01640 [Pandoraea sp. ISTKB]